MSPCDIACSENSLMFWITKTRARSSCIIRGGSATNEFSERKHAPLVDANRFCLRFLHQHSLTSTISMPKLIIFVWLSKDMTSPSMVDNGKAASGAKVSARAMMRRRNKCQALLTRYVAADIGIRAVTDIGADA